MKVERELVLVCLIAVLAGCEAQRGKGPAPTSQPAAAVAVVRNAERGPVKLTVKADRSELTIPEQLILTITVESELGVDAPMPEAGEVLGDFGVAKTSDAEPTQDDLMRQRQRVLTLDTAVPGPCEIPSVTIAFADRRPKADGSQTAYEDKVTTDPIRVTVREGLADVKGPVSLPLPLRYKLLLWGLGIVAAVVAIAVATRWWRRRREQLKTALPRARRVIAHEWALSELDKLAAENLVGRGLVQEFYYRINGLLRRYIELRFGMMAGEQTSEEFIRALQQAPSFDPQHKEVLRRFVAACDPVKYARHRPESSEIDWVQATARDFVLETAERREEVDSSPAGRRGGCAFRLGGVAMIILRNPWFLIALVLVPVIWWMWFRAGQRPALRFSGTSRLKTGRPPSSLRARYVLPVLRSLAVTLLVLSIARPQKADEETKVTTEGIAIQLVVDRSTSMGQQDFTIDEKGDTITRLQAVKDVVEAFISGDGETLKGRPDDLIGMIVFARYPDTECPLTRDHSHLIRAIKKVEPPPARSSEDATAIGDALLLGVERIRDVGKRFQQNSAFTIKSRAIILLTDGQHNAGKYNPTQAAEAAAALGVKVYTIGAAPAFQQRATLDLFSQQPQMVQVPVEVDEETLKKIAEMTGGKYFRAKDKDSLKAVYAEIDRLERSVVDETKYYQYEELAYKWITLGPVTLPPPLLVVLLLLAAEMALANTRFRKIP